MAASLVERVHTRERCFICDHVDLWEWTIQVEVGDIERRNLRYQVVLKVDDDVVRYLRVERVHEIMIAEFWRGVYDRTDARCSKRIGAGKLVGQAFGQSRTEAVT